MTDWANEVKAMGLRKRYHLEQVEYHNRASDMFMGQGKLIDSAWHSNKAAEHRWKATSADDMLAYAQARVQA